MGSFVPRPSPAPVFDRLQYAKTEPEGLVNLTAAQASHFITLICMAVLRRRLMLRSVLATTSADGEQHQAYTYKTYVNMLPCPESVTSPCRGSRGKIHQAFWLRFCIQTKTGAGEGLEQDYMHGCMLTKYDVFVFTITSESVMLTTL